MPDMAMVMARQNAVNQGIPQSLARTGSAMGSLAQPSQVSFTQGMQPSHPQSNLQNSVQMPNQLPISSPRPGSHPQSMPTPGPSQTPVNRTRMTPDNAINSAMFGISFQNSQFPANRVPNNGGTPTRSGFQLTPAQQLEQMNVSQDSFPTQFNMQPQRPPSRHNLHPSLPQQQPPFQPPLHQHSPGQSDSLATHAQRPSSQPQQMIPGRPPSQHGRRTPQNLLGITNMPGTRLPVASAATQPPHPPIAPRPPQQPVPSQVPPPIPPSVPSTDPSANPAPVSSQPNMPPQVGWGQGIQRLLQFSGILANESPKKLHLSWWEECIKEYFTPSAIMKITLWKDNQRTEAKPFEIGVPILPRFFLVTTQSGVKSMTLSLDGARERPYPRNPHHCIIECPSAVWTYRYSNGYTVTLRGPMTAHVVMSQPTLSSSDAASNFQGGQRHLKFENLQFDADQHDKFIMLDTVMSSRLSDSSIRKEPALTANGIQIQFQDDVTRWEEPRIMIERCLIPGEPVNAFGIPQATMRCLELAESVGQMTDLIVYSTENNLGPLAALKKFAAQLRESQSYGTFSSALSTGIPASNPPNALTFITSPMSHGGTLYSSAPPSVVNPQANPSIAGSSIASPQNAPSSATNSPLKQHKTIAQQQQQQSSQPGSAASSTVPATSPTVSSGGTTNTPHMAHSTLKRKQVPDAASPTISNADHQPQKRPQRKRRTAG
ncbi:hypothetical protein APHAL10511_005584 [Amanita phalloides]|nr:hypothetical protein APHAL10511_005584 [Amanita phalloides]